MRYDKLIRDKIISIIEAKGEQAIWHTATDSEYRAKLIQKLGEEAGEFALDPSKEELADIFEVITAILVDQGWTLEEIIAIQQEKREKRGGFESRIILEES
ncbi:MAG: nucleoside triphosphate pyrophosphohydrolase [Candidatus Moranbacteria bacterium]|nr:nucleoside triphosphate pyrophosphohydrolase [Candidatus Moranbacteria bacterium]MBP6034137.1 nucleoside triphosphate pyrophosphohydrolase [Candidatus Moranbacteria bacterium]MBP7695762.1 nucleoside triphosphate pyrophosphohydrolase [Candidatus Moranbacteria bacterium]